MRLKLDENFDIRLVPVLRSEGFDGDTVRDEGLSGSSDEVIYQVCRDSRQVLVTLDLDFSNPVRYPPEPTEGIVVVRVPSALVEPDSGNTAQRVARDPIQATEEWSLDRRAGKNPHSRASRRQRTRRS